MQLPTTQLFMNVFSLINICNFEIVIPLFYDTLNECTVTINCVVGNCILNYTVVLYYKRDGMSVIKLVKVH
jgi:hypothetical protein